MSWWRLGRRAADARLTRALLAMLSLWADLSLFLGVMLRDFFCGGFWFSGWYWYARAQIADRSHVSINILHVSCGWVDLFCRQLRAPTNVLEIIYQWPLGDGTSFVKETIINVLLLLMDPWKWGETSHTRFISMVNLYNLHNFLNRLNWLWPVKKWISH